MGDELTFAAARAEFPVLERIAYLNAGSMGPLQRAAGEAIAAAAARDLAEGRSGKTYYEELLALRDGVRGRIAELLGVDRENVALTSSTTDGCNIVVAGLGLGPGDEVVTTDSEHPGLLAPLHASGVRVVVAPTSTQPAAAALETILARVTGRTRLLALSHVCWTTGQVFPVHELKSETGLPVLVDGAQSVGAIAVSAGELDFYTVSCQKWLCGPEPLGALYVRDPEGLRVARPTAFSQASIEPDGSFEPKPGALRFDSGWLARPSLAGLLAALDAAPTWRFERGAATAEACRQRLADAGLEVVTEPGQATLVSFVPPDAAADAVARAGEQGVVVRELPGTGWCRASCGYWTSEDDLVRLVAAMRLG
ncbi:MAG TPA: aminotransferase class V-fold PLP-dependent enzyme [Gaiellaceae bacterium]